MRRVLLIAYLLSPVAALAQEPMSREEALAACYNSCASPMCRAMYCPDGEGDSRYFYCKKGSWAWAPCYPNGDIIRYYKLGSPYRRDPPYRRRYGDDE